MNRIRMRFLATATGCAATVGWHDWHHGWAMIPAWALTFVITWGIVEALAWAIRADRPRTYATVGEYLEATGQGERRQRMLAMCDAIEETARANRAEFAAWADAEMAAIEADVARGSRA